MKSFCTGLPPCLGNGSQPWSSCLCKHSSSTASLSSLLGRVEHLHTMIRQGLVSMQSDTKHLITIPSYHDVSHFSDTHYLARCLGSIRMALASSLAVMVWAVHCTPRSTFFYLSSERIPKSSPSSLPRNHFHSLKKKKAPHPNFFKCHRFQ